MTELSFCSGCVAGKMHRKPFPTVGEIRSSRKLQLVHSDACGPVHTESIGGAKYFLTFLTFRCVLQHKCHIVNPITKGLICIKIRQGLQMVLSSSHLMMENGSDKTRDRQICIMALLRISYCDFQLYYTLNTS